LAIAILKIHIEINNLKIAPKMNDFCFVAAPLSILCTIVGRFFVWMH